MPLRSVRKLWLKTNSDCLPHFGGEIAGVILTSDYPGPVRRLLTNCPLNLVGVTLTNRALVEEY